MRKKLRCYANPYVNFLEIVEAFALPWIVGTARRKNRARALEELFGG